MLVLQLKSFFKILRRIIDVDDFVLIFYNGSQVYLVVDL